MTLKNGGKQFFLEKHYAGARANIEQKPHGASLKSQRGNEVRKMVNFELSYICHNREAEEKSGSLVTMGL